VLHSSRSLYYVEPLIQPCAMSCNVRNSTSASNCGLCVVRCDPSCALVRVSALETGVIPHRGDLQTLCRSADAKHLKPTSSTAIHQGGTALQVNQFSRRIYGRKPRLVTDVHKISQSSCNFKHKQRILTFSWLFYGKPRECPDSRSRVASATAGVSESLILHFIQRS
jgi:hypothetical protein